MKKINSLIIFIFVVFFFCGCSSSKQKNEAINFSFFESNNNFRNTFFAHRGLCKECPENTMEAFQAAYDEGFRAIELDVRFCKDEVPVVFHDRKLKRMSREKAFVKDLSFENLKRIRLGNKKQLKNEKNFFIPSFEEYCAWASGKKDLFTIVEIKSDDDWKAGNEEKLIELLKKYGIENRIIFASFDPVPLKLIKNNYPKMKCSFISNDKKLDVFNFTVENGFDCIALQWKLVKPDFIQKCHENNILINIWTANSYEEAISFSNMGGDFITGNF